MVPIAEGDGPTLDGEMLGELALSHVRERYDPRAAAELLRLSRSRGGGAAAIIAEASLMIRGAPPAPGAVRLLDEAVARAPDAFLPRLYRASLRHETGRRQEALEDLDRALRLAPGDERARHLRLKVLNALGRPAEARAEAEALLATPYGLRLAGVWEEAARAAAALGRFEDGIREMRHYLEREPMSAAEWIALAQMYEATGRTEEAREARTNAERARRNRVLVAHQEALRAERFGYPERAATLLREALALDPGYEPARRDLARVSGEVGRR